VPDIALKGYHYGYIFITEAFVTTLESVSQATPADSKRGISLALISVAQMCSTLLHCRCICCPSSRGLLQQH
jgi:hypothetical protein